MSATDVLETQRDLGADLRSAPRRLVVTWQHPESRGIHPIGLLTFDGNSYEFRYIRHALSVKDFSPLIGFPHLDAPYTSDDLFPLFAQRVMDPRRADFHRYVTRLGLSGDTAPWEQLARSGGRRVGDTLQLFPEPVVQDGEMTCAFLAHGIRHIGERPIELADCAVTVTRDQVERALQSLEVGDELDVVAEPGNAVNPNALLVASDGTPVGYVPNLLVDDLANLLQRSELRAVVELVNGPEAPWHLRLLGRLHASSVGDFKFFRDSGWKPLS